MDKNEFCNRILKCKLKRCLSPIINFYQLVYNHWRKELEAARKRRIRYHHPEKEGLPLHRTDREVMPRPRRGSHRKSNSVESSETNATLTEKEQVRRACLVKEEFFSGEGCYYEDSSESEMGGCEMGEMRKEEVKQETPYHFEKKEGAVGYTKLQRKPAERRMFKKEDECERPHKKFERHKDESIASI